MTKTTVAALKAERDALLALIAKLTAETPKADSKATKQKRSKQATNRQFDVMVDAEKTAKYGVEYCSITFLGVQSKADFSEIQNAGYEAIKAARWGSHGKGKFRFSRKGWCGQLAHVPSIVRNNS